MKFVSGKKGSNPEKNLPRLHFVHHEIHMEGPRRELWTPAVGGELLTQRFSNCGTAVRWYDINK